MSWKRSLKNIRTALLFPKNGCLIDKLKAKKIVISAASNQRPLCSKCNYKVTKLLSVYRRASMELSRLTNLNELIRTKRKKSFRPFLDPEKKSSENLKDFFPPGGTAKLDPKESLRDVYWRQTGEIFSEDFSSVIFFSAGAAGY